MLPTPGHSSHREFLDLCSQVSFDFICGVVEGAWTSRSDRSGLCCGSVTYQMSDAGESAVPVICGFWHHFHRIVVGMKESMSYLIASLSLCLDFWATQMTPQLADLTLEVRAGEAISEECSENKNK